MPKLETILVPIDVAQPEAAEAALALARDAARAYGGRLVLLSVLAPVPGYVKAQLPASLHEQSVEFATGALKKLAAKHEVEEDAKTVVLDGHPSTRILEYAGEASVDLIVIASHDPGMADLFLGSTAARVVRHAHCSVLVVRAKRK